MFSSSEWKPHWQQNINDSGVWQWNIYVVDKDFGVSLKAITVKQQIILCWLTICIDVLRRSYEGERCCTRGRSANLFTEAALKDQCSYKTCCLWSYMCDAHFSSAGKIFFFFVCYLLMRCLFFLRGLLKDISNWSERTGWEKADSQKKCKKCNSWTFNITVFLLLHFH